MSNLLVKDNNALKLFMTEDLYILPEKIEEKPSQRAETPAVSAPLIKEEEIPTLNSLPAPEEAKVSTKKDISFSYIGENNKYFLILIDDKKHTEISTVHQETLLKIMSAKGLEMRDLAILNLDKHKDVSFSDLKTFFSCNRITLFGIDPKRIALPSMSSNKVETHMDVKILATFSIDEMINDVAKKKEFWAVMKEF